MFFNKSKLTQPNGNINLNWEKEGIELHWWTGDMPFHTHGDFYEICIATEGSCIHIINNISTKLTDNTIIFIPPYSSHALISDKDKNFVH